MGGLGNLMFKEAYIFARMKEGLISDTYVQSEKYWEKCKEEIKAKFGVGIKSGSLDFVSLHVRRGDYVDNPFYFHLWETDYYEKAMKEFPNEKFLIFCSDKQGRDKTDMDWCAERFKGEKFVFYIPNTETEDMNSMASCKGHIMANSSFSWWAAYLGGGKTVCPKQWFSDGIQRCELLDNWIKI